MNIKELQQVIEDIRDYRAGRAKDRFHSASRWRIDQLDKLFTRELIDELKVELIVDLRESGPWDYPIAFTWEDRRFQFHNIYESGAVLHTETSTSATKSRAAATPEQLAQCLVELLPFASKPRQIEGEVFSADDARGWDQFSPEDLVRELYG